MHTACTRPANCMLPVVGLNLTEALLLSSSAELAAGRAAYVQVTMWGLCVYVIVHVQKRCIHVSGCVGQRVVHSFKYQCKKRKERLHCFQETFFCDRTSV